MAPDGRGRYSGERFASGIGAGAGRRLVDTALQLRVPLLPPDWPRLNAANGNSKGG